jgi:hypothetical protein
MPRDILEGAPRSVLLLPRDERGYPIPYIQFRSGDGAADFRVVDEEKKLAAIRQNRCAICGQHLSTDLWLIGGPACREHGTFSELPMHGECVRYAARTCPFVAGSTTRYSTRELPREEGRAFSVEPSMADAVRRPPVMYLCKTAWVGFLEREGVVYTRAHLPWLEVWAVPGGGAEPYRVEPIEEAAHA